MPRYLQKRVHRWYAILEIPKPLRKRFGKARFVQTLETESLAVAERRMLPVIARWKKEIAEAQNEPVDDDAAYWRRRLSYAKDDEQKEAILHQIEQEAWEIGAVNVDQIGQSPTTDPDARKFHASATGQLLEFDAYLDEWMSTSTAKAKTQSMQRTDVKRIAKEFKLVSDVSRPEVRRWITKLMNEEELKPKTVQRILSAVRGYWRYLQSIQVVDEDHEPFQKLDVARYGKRPAPGDKRLPFEPKAVLKLLAGAEALGDNELSDLIQLGMWTGCRIEEICSLKVKDVRDGYITIHDAKTEAGWRDIPIHKKLNKTIERLIDDRDDGFVLANLSTNKYGDRSNAISKRFGRLKTEMGFGHQHVFHSIRKTVITILENAGIPENIVADIVGHEKTTMTYGLYSGGVSIVVKKQALDYLAY